MFVATTHETGSAQSYPRLVCGSRGEGGASAGGGRVRNHVGPSKHSLLACGQDVKVSLDSDAISRKTADKLQNHAQNRKLTGHIRGSFIL